MKSRANESKGELAQPLLSAAGIGQKVRYPKRRANLLYKLRRHGITVDTKQRVIFIPYGDSPWRFPQVRRLNQEYYFNIQFIIL